MGKSMVSGSDFPLNQSIVSSNCFHAVSTEKNGIFWGKVRNCPGAPWCRSDVWENLGVLCWFFVIKLVATPQKLLIKSIIYKCIEHIKKTSSINIIYNCVQTSKTSSIKYIEHVLKAKSAKNTAQKNMVVPGWGCINKKNSTAGWSHSGVGRRHVLPSSWLLGPCTEGWLWRLWKAMECYGSIAITLHFFVNEHQFYDHGNLRVIWRSCPPKKLQWIHDSRDSSDFVG